MSMKTIATLQGDVLDLSDYEFTSLQDLVNAVFKVCERYNKWAPMHLPDILRINSEQAELFPPNIEIMRSPYNVMEIQRPKLDKQNDKANNDNI